jgi:AcrR family transcriptional regulator
MPGVYVKLYIMSSGDPDTRKRILEKTWHLMEKKKGQTVRVEDIARAAGVSRQAVYLHFGSRTELLVATVRYVDEVSGVSNRLQDLYKAATGLEALEAYINFWGNYIPVIYGLAKALLIERETDAAAAAAWEDRMKALRLGCNNVIKCLVHDHQLAPVWNADQASDALWAMSSLAVWENLTIDCGWSASQYIDRMTVLLKQTFIKSG